MAHTSIGAQKIRRVGSSLVVTIPKLAAEALGIGEGDRVEVSLQPVEPRSRLRPEVRAAAEAALQQIEPGLRYLADK
jgi:antitoxin component of MazEF toxin-antitoxin module